MARKQSPIRQAKELRRTALRQLCPNPGKPVYLPATAPRCSCGSARFLGDGTRGEKQGYGPQPGYAFCEACGLRVYIDWK